MFLLGYISLYLAIISISIAISIQFKDILFKKKGETSYKIVKKIYLFSIISIWISTITLVLAFIKNNFLIKYVAEHSSLNLPIIYKIAALWGGQSGSMLFWCFILSIYFFIFIFSSKKVDTNYKLYIYLILGLSLLFFIFLTIEYNPFKIFPMGQKTPNDGLGMNPQLQTFSMLLHPPLLYLGYIGYNIVVAFLIGGIILKIEPKRWIKLSKGWNLISWLFLTAGNILGAQWAYTELGWGGFWAWDPVENASFIPWITSTIYLHFSFIAEKKRMFIKWSVITLWLTYFLTILGTFITRSGFIESVHAFTKSDIGWYFIIFMAINLIFFITIIIFRRDHLSGGEKIVNLTSKEGLILTGNIFFIILMVIILVGTLSPAIFPLFGKKISIGTTFFNKVSPPLGVIISLSLSFSLFSNWRKAIFSKNITIPIIISSIISLFLTFLIFKEYTFTLNRYHLYKIIITFSSFFTIVSIFTLISINFYTIFQIKRSILSSFNYIFYKRYKKIVSHIAHIGISLIFIGIMGSTLSIQNQNSLKKGDKISIKNYQLLFKEITMSEGVVKDRVNITISVYKNDQFITNLTPHKNFYHTMMGGVTSEVAIYSTIYHDLYLVLQSFDLDRGEIVIQTHIKPFMIWLWIGGLLLFLSILYPMLINFINFFRFRDTSESKSDSDPT